MTSTSASKTQAKQFGDFVVTIKGRHANVFNLKQGNAVLSMYPDEAEYLMLPGWLQVTEVVEATKGLKADAVNKNEPKTFKQMASKDIPEDVKKAVKGEKNVPPGTFIIN